MKKRKITANIKNTKNVNKNTDLTIPKKKRNTKTNIINTGYTKKSRENIRSTPSTTRNTKNTASIKNTLSLIKNTVNTQSIKNTIKTDIMTTKITAEMIIKPATIVT